MNDAKGIISRLKLEENILLNMREYVKEYEYAAQLYIAFVIALSSSGVRFVCGV